MMPASSNAIMMTVRGGFIAFSLFAALILNMLPWSGFWLTLRPDFLALALVYWCVYHPGRLGFGAVWALGLVMDVSDATLFGQHALAYIVLLYLVIYLHRRILMFGMKHQVAHLFGMLLAMQLIMLLVRKAAGADFPGMGYFMPSVTGALLWPLICRILQWPERRRPEPV
jgi:rod shape-determining protein MreD